MLKLNKIIFQFLTSCLPAASTKAKKPNLPKLLNLCEEMSRKGSARVLRVCESQERSELYLHLDFKW